MRKHFADFVIFIDTLLVILVEVKFFASYINEHINFQCVHCIVNATINWIHEQSTESETLSKGLWPFLRSSEL